MKYSCTLLDDLFFPFAHQTWMHFIFAGDFIQRFLALYRLQAYSQFEFRTLFLLFLSHFFDLHRFEFFHSRSLSSCALIYRVNYRPFVIG